jgi:hypothetical protein
LKHATGVDGYNLIFNFMEEKKNKNYLNSLEKNIFAEKWLEIEKDNNPPKKYGKAKIVEYEEFSKKIIKQDVNFVKDIISSFYSGDLYIVKNVLSKNEVDYIINETFNYNQSTPSSFFKMIEGVPNFHRWIDKSLESKYTIKYSKHSTYLFNWNKDIGKIREIIQNACRPFKLLSGLSLTQFERNTPKEKIVERLQIARYPPQGFIEPHTDAHTLLRLVISGYLSRRGESYKEGGFYLCNNDGSEKDVESLIESGDVGLFYASLRHGMRTIDPNKEPDIKKRDGRWWYGLNVHHSDHVDNTLRHTTKPVFRNLRK